MKPNEEAKVETFAYNDSEVVAYISEVTEFDILKLGRTSFDVPYSLTRTSAIPLSVEDDKFLDFVEKLNYFKHTVSKIIVYRYEGFGSLCRDAEIFTMIIFQLKSKNENFVNKLLNIFCKKDSFEKHKIVAGLFNTLFFNEKDKESNASHDPLLNNVSAIVDVLILFTA